MPKIYTDLRTKTKTQYVITLNTEDYVGVIRIFECFKKWMFHPHKDAHETENSKPPDEEKDNFDESFDQLDAKLENLATDILKLEAVIGDIKSRMSDGERNIEEMVKAEERLEEIMKKACEDATIDLPEGET